MHQSLQMVSTCSLHTKHCNSRQLTVNKVSTRGPSRLPPLNLRHCTSKTVWEVYYEHTTGIRGFKPDVNKLRDSFTKLLYTAGTGGIRFS